MTLKKITVHVRLSEDAVTELKSTYPAIIQQVNIEGVKTVFFVDITPAQEDQIKPVLMDAIIKIETL